MAGKHIQVFYVASTHWDREWYETFQGFRYHLVELMDEVLETMQRDERYAVFQTDGQSILVEDYLEIRPERAESIRALARAGRLRLGPWYTMPDENLVLGESLIRNLEEGLRVARDFGHASYVGFVPDMFGHVSQLPQIFRGFGIDNAFVFRGVNEDRVRGLFRWCGADGSELLTVRLGPKDGYFEFAAIVRAAFDHTARFDADEIVKKAAEFVRIQDERMGTGVVLLFDGGDHQRIEPRMPDILDALRKRAPELEVTHTGLGEFVAAMKERAGSVSRSVAGELRDPGRLSDGMYMIPGVLSSRVRLKQANRACEARLTQWAEPFSLLAQKLAGSEYPHGFLRRAWRHLLENHAHDSICGCSPDPIHKDMEFRFAQAEGIAEKVTSHALQALATRVELPDQTGEDFAVVAFNPTQADIDGPVELELWFDENTKNIYQEFFRYEKKVGFRLYDEDGNELPYDYQGYHPQLRRFSRPLRKVVWGQECLVVTVTVPLKIPALGYTTLTCRPVAEPTRHPVGGIGRGDRELENEHLRVTVNDNGSLTLVDKRTDQTYERLLVFEDRADIGDGWFHGVAVNDRSISSTACAADVALVADGAHAATLQITTRMEVPESFVWGTTMRRSPRTQTQVLETFVTLRRGADWVELRTTTDNQIRDHRVRVLFETGTAADSYLADSAFDVVRRTIGLPADNHTYKELAVETTPQQSWTAVHDERRGLAVIAPGLPETAVRDVPQRTLAQTLWRSFRRTLFTAGEEGGQSLGTHEFRYWLVPLGGPPDPVRLGCLAQRVSGGLRAVEVSAKTQAPPEERTLPRTHRGLRLVPGRALVSSLRRHPEKEVVELRLFNVLDEELHETVSFGSEVRAAHLTSFEGKSVDALSVSQDAVTVRLAPREIVTVAVRLAER